MEKLSPFKTEMLKRGFSFNKDEDHFVNEKGEIAVEIADPDRSIIYGYNLQVKGKEYTTFIFEQPMEDRI